ncbi:lysylphosphatidylglycerol synthase domain-containing protein, partial [Paracidovorax cattleyae]
AVWVLAGRDTPYAAALATVLLGAVAGLVSRIPAGLGVLEAVGTAVLSAYIPTSQALATVLAYRALYFFAPLVLAALAFGAVECFGRGAAPKAEEEGASPSGKSPGKVPA